MKLVNDNINYYINEEESAVDPVYRVRMVGDIEFTKSELEEYMTINGLRPDELKKAATGIAKVKWRNRIKKSIETNDTSYIDESNFKFNTK
ncbi:MAG: hypothetical protein ACRDD8_14750 [Bacteroidales bacterium]